MGGFAIFAHMSAPLIWKLGAFVDIHDWSKSGNIAIWRYEPQAKNFPGWHMSCDSEGYKSLNELLSLFLDSDPMIKRTLVLDTPDPYIASSTLKKTVQNKLVIVKSSDDSQWLLSDDCGKLKLDIGSGKIAELMDGMDGALAGKYDFSVGATNGQNLWFW